MISVAVIDDEARARETVLNILKLSHEDLRVVGEADSVQSGFDLIVQEKPELVFLDIQLLDGSGFDLLKRFIRIDFRVVFITAHEEHAVKAFKYSALDYILKPVRAGELLETVSRFAKQQQKEDTELKISAFLANLDKMRKIVLKTAESLHILNIDQIIRCEADVNYTRFYLAGGEHHLVSKTLKEYDNMLQPSGFFRTHQSHLVNLDHVIRYEKTEGGHLIMSDQSLVPVSQRKKEELFRIFEKL